MKLRSLNGFGSLGVEVYDFDLMNCADSDLQALGHIVADQLLVYVNKKCSNGIDAKRINYIASVFGDPNGGNNTENLTSKMLKYRREHNQLSKQDIEVIRELNYLRQGFEDLPGLIRVSGKRDQKGNRTGIFSEGELDWHSDRQGTGVFTPVLALCSVEGTDGTHTEFLQTHDQYLNLPKEKQAEVQSLIGVHVYTPGKLAPGLNMVQDSIVRMNMCPIDGSEVPLFCKSPTGRPGVRLNLTTLEYFKGYSRKESDALISFYRDWFMRDEYKYSHCWQDGETIFMDQTITLHRRPTKDCSQRTLLRQKITLDKILGKGTQGFQNIGHEEPGIQVDGQLVTRDEFFKKFKISGQGTY
jgi:alpha-ketoglutarate-dependent taurine dioxygenase